MERQYPENILKKLRLRQDLDDNDTSKDEEFNRISPNEVFEEVLSWEGFVGYAHTIKAWIKQIYGIDIDKL